MSKQKIGLIAGVICAILLAAVFVTKLRYEWKVQGAIEDTLAALPLPLVVKAGDIDVSFINKSVTLTNVKGSYTLTIPQNGAEQSVPMEYAVSSIVATGVNIDGFKEGAGVARLLDSLTVTDVTFTSPLAQAAIEHYYFEGVSADFAQLAVEIQKSLPVLMEANAVANYHQDKEEVQRLMHGIAAMLKAYETVRIKKSAVRNYKYSLDIEGAKVDVLMEAMEASNYSLREMGPISMNNLHASMNGEPFMEMESLAMDGMVLPSFVALLEEIARTPSPSFPALQKALKGQPFSIKNLRIKGVTVRNPLLQDNIIFSLDGSNFSYVAEDAHSMDFSFSNLNIDKSVILEQTGIPASVLAGQPDIISFEGDVQQQAKIKAPDTYDVEIKRAHIKGAGLGEADLSLAANNINNMAVLMGFPGDAELQKFEISLTDAGLSNVVFELEGMRNGKSAEEIRAQELAQLSEHLEDETSIVGKEILAGVITFLEKAGGTLSIAIAPPNPVGLDMLLEFFETGEPDMGFSISVTQSN